MTGTRTPEIDLDSDQATVLGKAVRILETLSQHPEMGLSELARVSGLHKASVNRLCGQLEGYGIIERKYGTFRLGSRLFEFGQSVPSRRVLRDAALPFMEDVFLVTRETVHLAVLDGRDVLYVEKIAGNNVRPMPESRVAGRLPASCTATGKCLLAEKSDSDLDEWMTGPLASMRPRSIVDRRRLREDLLLARERGYAVEREECRDGQSSLAVVVRVGRRAVASMSVTAKTDTFSEVNLANALRTACRGLERQLVGTGSVFFSAPVRTAS